MTARDEEERTLEQKYFDKAWDAREASRATLQSAHLHAGGNRAVQGAVAKAARERIETLAGPDEEVAFGRIDLEDGPIYVGKHGISDDNRDQLVVNWKLPIAQLFYQSSHRDPRGVARRRKFITNKNTIKAFEDLVFADIAARVGELTREEELGIDEPLLKDLERHRDGAMRDIVQTIHASQDSLIRTPADRLLVIQGGPGTGKTVVALHRVSWLLFNHAETMTPDDVLVVGPSRTFSQYISQVLPALGDRGVVTGDLRTLGPQASSGREEELEVARLKGQPKMAEFLRRALRRRVRFPQSEDELVVGSGAAGARFSRAEIEAQLNQRRDGTTYVAGRQGLRAWLQAEASTRTRSSTAVTATAVDAALERVWPQLTPMAFLQDLLGSRVQIGDAAGDDFTAGDIGRLYRMSADRLSDEAWSDSDVALLDEAQELISGSAGSFGHIIVDEAQDLSPMQLRSIARRTSTGSCTIVGDIAQSTGPWARDSWDDIVAALDKGLERAFEELAYGYRVPRQIYEFAQQLLPLAAPGVTPPKVIRDGASDPNVEHAPSAEVAAVAVQHAQRYAAKGLFVGVICSPENHEAIVDALGDADVSYDDARDGRLGKSINLMTAEQSKGLEFEAAVVVEPANIADATTTGLRLLYVALTRTTKHVSVVHHKAFLPLGLDGSDEGTHEVVDDIVQPTATAVPAKSVAEAPGEESETHGAASVRPGATQPARTRRSIAGLIAADLGQEIRDQLNPDTFPEFINALRTELGLSADEVLDGMID